MNQQTNDLFSSTSLRFKRWSRKAYAVFLSLGKIVTIGRLSVDIANASESKTEGFQNFTLKEFGDTSMEELYSQENLDLGLQLITPSLESVVLVRQNTEIVGQPTKLYDISRKSVYFSGFFLSIKNGSFRWKYIFHFRF